MHWCRWYLFVTLSQLQWPVAPTRVNLTLDLAIVYVSQHWTNQTNKFKECTKLLPREHFNFNEALTRIAIVAREGGADDWKVITPGGLTSNEAEFEQSVSELTNIYQPGYTDFQKPLELVRAEVFTGPAAIGRTSFVVVITTNDEKTPIGARKVAGLLRGYGVGIHVITERGNKEELSNLTGDPQKVDVHDRLATTMCQAFGTLQNVTIVHACQPNNACFFADQSGTCAKGKWTPRTPTDVFDCAAIWCPPLRPTGESCPKEECSGTCDKFWPLEKEQPSCTPETCGRNFSTRTGPMRWKELQHCPQYMQCPACRGIPIWAIAVWALLGVLGVCIVVGGVVLMMKKDSGKTMGRIKAASVSACDKIRSAISGSLSMKPQGTKRKGRK